MRRGLYSVILALFATAVLFGQNQFDDVQIKETKLTENIYMLEGSGGNIGLFVGAKDVLIIDDQYAPLSEKISAKIKELSGKSVAKVINTHWHGDHTGGNENFGKAGALIIAHENVRGRMSKEFKRGDQVSPASPDIALPVITYSDAMQLYFMGEPILVTHVHNGHTDGDSFVFFPESNVIHLGDCFFNKRFPYIDVNSGGSINGIIAAAEAALMIVDDNTQIIPGHGPMANKADLQYYLTFLQTIRDRVQAFVENGRGLESMDPEKITEGYAELAWGFIDAKRFTEIVHTSLTSGN